MLLGLFFAFSVKPAMAGSCDIIAPENGSAPPQGRVGILATFQCFAWESTNIVITDPNGSITNKRCYCSGVDCIESFVAQTSGIWVLDAQIGGTSCDQATINVGGVPITPGAPGCTINQCGCKTSCPLPPPGIGSNLNQSQINDGDCPNPKSEACNACIKKNNAWTALGCLPTGDPNVFAAWLLQFALGIGGGVALILLIGGGISIATSGGVPEKVKKGKETITAALTGLIFIIFSVFLLQLIGAGILNLPGFK